jgi:hypothetical protein
MAFTQTIDIYPITGNVCQTPAFKSFPKKESDIDVEVFLIQFRIAKAYCKKDEVEIDINATNQLEVSQYPLPDYYNKNQKILKTSFDKELMKFNKDYKDIAITTFNQTSPRISELQFKKGVLEVTQSQSIKYTLIFDSNLVLMLSKPFKELESVRKNEIIFSVFRNKELILSNVSEISTFIEGFKKFLTV